MSKITVFTPTYNRAKYLGRLYESLIKQTYKDFEWLVVDDGSTDDTESWFDKILLEKKIDIKYFKTINGGKHRAINKGLELAKGELFFIVDSDDYLLENALEKIVKWEKSIEKESNIVGVVGLRGYSEKEMIGHSFNGAQKDLLIYDREKYKIFGDKAEVYYTDILKKYRFPEFESENFVSEALVWNQLAIDGYKLRYFNEIIYICEYLENGLTKNIEQKYRENPKGFLEYIKQLLYINKWNIFNKIKYVSYYKYIFEGIYDDKKVSKDLGVSLLFLKIGKIVRKLFKTNKK